MNIFVAWVILGVILGCTTSMIVNVNAQQVILLNILVGNDVGAKLAMHRFVVGFRRRTSAE